MRMLRMPGGNLLSWTNNSLVCTQKHNQSFLAGNPQINPHRCHQVETPICFPNRWSSTSTQEWGSPIYPIYKDSPLKRWDDHYPLETTPLTLADIPGNLQWQGLFPFIATKTNPLAPGKITDLMDLISSWEGSGRKAVVLHVCC